MVKIKVLFIFLSGILFIGMVVFLTNIYIEKENAARIEKTVVSYKERLRACIGIEDDLLLNNFLDSLKNQPEVMRISVAENGRIIADTDTGEINTLFEETSVSKITPDSPGIRRIYDSFSIKNKKYSIFLKLSAKTSKYLETLTMNIFTAAFIYTVICVFILTFASADKLTASPARQFSPAQSPDILSFLTGSKTAIVLVLSGDNKILEASIKAFEMFGRDICGKSIAELKAFNEITDVIVKGRKPVLSGGKKYLVF